MIKGKDPIEIADGVYWLGSFLDKRLEINSYLRIFKNGDKTINMIIDPGPPTIFENLRDNLLSLDINLSKIHFVFLNHQDPDVSANTMYIRKANPRVKVICSEDTWRLVNFLGLEPSNFQNIDKFKSHKAKLSTGHRIRFIPTPFCHFRGANMIYDETSRILFTGDLFGGITYSNGLFATSVNWHGMRAFHQLYMPSPEALKFALNSIRSLRPRPVMLAPQHGAIIKGELIDEFIDKLYELPVGWNLLETINKNKDFYLEAVNDILDFIKARSGEEIIEAAFREIQSDDSIPDIFERNEKGKIIDIRLDPSKSMHMLINALRKDQPQETIEIIRNAILKAAVDWNLPLFESLLEDKSITSELLVPDQSST